jgi:hypothetical protein
MSKSGSVQSMSGGPFYFQRIRTFVLFGRKEDRLLLSLHRVGSEIDLEVGVTRGIWS